MRSVYLNSYIRAVFSVYYGLVGRASRFCCWGVYWKWWVTDSSRPFASALRSVYEIPFPIKKLFTLGCKTSDKQVPHWNGYLLADLRLQQDRKMWCRRESFDWAIPMAFCTETRSYPTVIWPKCSKNSAPRSENLFLQNCGCTRTEWKGFWNPYNVASVSYTHLDVYKRQGG